LIRDGCGTALARAIPFKINWGGVMTQDIVLMDMLGAAFQIVTFSAIALFAVALIAVLWLCCTDQKSPDN